MTPSDLNTSQEAVGPVIQEKRFQVNSIINANCLDVLAHLKPSVVDLTVFSPPYDTIRDYKNDWSFDYTELGQSLYRMTAVDRCDKIC